MKGSSRAFVGLTLLVIVKAGPLIEEERPSRIVHGRDVKPGEITYQAALTTPSGFAFCGGTLIKPGWVLTAAHCTLTKKADEIKVVLGALNLKNSDNPVYRVKQIHRYDYDANTKRGDLSILELDELVQGREDSLDHPMHPVSLPLSDFDPSGRSCVVSGWGRLKSGGFEKPQIMQMVNVVVPENNVCAEMLPGQLPWDRETDSMICAGGADKDACQGDSGGPLVCPSDNGDRYISGIVSWGVGCATEGIPGVYTNVRKYVSWINDTINSNSQQFLL